MDYEDGESLTVLSCKHLYHPECINNWLKINKVLLLLCFSNLMYHVCSVYFLLFNLAVYMQSIPIFLCGY